MAGLRRRQVTKVTRSPKCVKNCYRGLFLATLGEGPEPKTRRSGLVRWRTCKAVSGIRAFRKLELQTEGNIYILHQRRFSRRSDIMWLSKRKGVISTKRS